MTRTAIYCRYSSTNQDKGVSIELQLEVCRKLAGNDPLEFIDRAVSGRTMQREAFRQMLDAADRKEFDRLVVYKWDRFGRNAETHATIADLEDLGVAVSSATEGDDFLARGVGLLVSEDYSRKLSQRVRDSMRIRFKNNKSFMGGLVPFGYRKVVSADGLSRLEVDPDQAECVRTIFRLINTESMGFLRLSHRLESLGYCPPKGGKKFQGSSLTNIVSNEIYVGKVVYGRRSQKLDRRTGRVKLIHHPASEHLVYRDESLRIVSDDEFKSAHRQRAKQALRMDYITPNQVRVFTNVAICGCCGSPMYTRFYSKARNNPRVWLSCGKRDRDGKCCCPNNYHPDESLLLDWVQVGIRKVLGNRDQIIRRAVEIAEKSLSTEGKRRASLQSELSKVEQALGRVQKLLRDPSIDERQMRGLLSQIGACEEERESINSRLRELDAESSVDRRSILREVRTALDDAESSILNVATPAVMNKALHRFCGQLSVAPDGRISSIDRVLNAPKAPPV